jgi:hypothetical protein
VAAEEQHTVVLVVMLLVVVVALVVEELQLAHQTVFLAQLAAEILAAVVVLHREGMVAAAVVRVLYLFATLTHFQT